MFDAKGSFIPSSDHRVFSYPSSDYYKLNLDFSPQDLIRSLCDFHNNSGKNLEQLYINLFNQIRNDSLLTNILEGPFIPFCLNTNTSRDIGSILEADLLPSLNSSFLQNYPYSHFKVVSQDKPVSYTHLTLPTKA